MQQSTTHSTSSASQRVEARIAKGYSIEHLSIATGLTVNEIAISEQADAVVPEQHAKRIEQALR